LPSSEIYDSYQDYKGYLWFTSDRGIIRYDGYKFKVYTTNDGLHNNTYFTITAFGDVLFFCSIDGNIDCIKNDEVVQIKQPHLPNQKVYGWYSILDVDTLHSEMIIVSPSLPKYIKYNYKNGKTEEYNPMSISPIEKKYFYMGNCGIQILRPREDGSTRYPTRFHYKDKLDSIWVAYFLYEGHITTYSGTKKIIDIQLNKKNPIYCSKVVNNQIWVGTNIGLMRFNMQGKILDTIYKQFEASSISIDFENNIWITTLNKGIIRIPSQNIDEIKTPTIDNIKNRIVCLKKIKSSILMVSNNATFIIADNETGKFEKYWTNTDHPHTNDVIVLGDTIFSYTAQIIYKNKQLKIHKTDNDPEYTRRTWGYGYAGMRLNNGQIISAYHLSYSIWDKDYTNLLGSSANLHSKVLCFGNGPDNTIFIGAVNGLFAMKMKNPFQASRYFIPNLDSNIRINYIQKQGAYWYLSTSGQGLVITNLHKSMVITESTGLVSNLVHKVAFDNNGYVWIATNKGLVKMSVDFANPINGKHTFETFSANSGLSGNYISDILIDKNKIWIATNNGLNILNISHVFNIRNAPKINIEKIISGNNTFILTNNKTFEFKNYDNDIRIHFTGICFEKPVNGMFYQYRIIGGGLDSNWVHTDEREIQFTNLIPGCYIFEVKAGNNNQLWSLPAKISFKIAAHFTQTVWFKIFLIFFILFVIFIFFRTNYFRNRNKQEQLQKLQQAELRKREADLNTLRNQMNPHFIYNAMNSVQSMIYQEKFDEANDFLVRFSTLMRKTLEFSKSEYISIANEVLFLQNYLSIEISRFPNLFEFSIKADNNLLQEDVNIPALLIQPIVENSVKHAFKKVGNTGKLYIEIVPDPDLGYVHAYIMDNGVGLQHKGNEDAAVNRKSYGLEIVKERLLLFKEQGYYRAHMAIEPERDDMKTIIHLTIPVIS
ncbi:MAG: histidine kinase, partial [Bacteroidia bacterium]|nr:histidine kinase [Bacteroidia bacterium]